MKKFTLHTILIFILVFLTSNAFSQIFKGEIIGGTNLSQVDGDEAYGYKKYGLLGGVGVIMPVYKNWSLSIETLYSQKGSKLRPQFNDSLDGSYKLKLNYAEVPFMIQYTDRDVASAGIGVSWNRLVKVDEFRNGYQVDSVSILTKVFDRDDWMAFADVRVRVFKGLILNARYSYSIDKIATRTVIDSESGKPNVRNWYNNVWSFRLIYMINEKRPEKSVKRKEANDE